MEPNIFPIPKLAITIHENEIEEGALKILQVIRPDWIKENIKFKLLTDGITNKLVRCKLLDVPESTAVLVRVYGNKTDLLIDRNAETSNILNLNKAGLAPRLYATFENGLAYEYVPGCTLTDETVLEPKIYQLVAKHMARIHKITPPGEQSQPMLWTKMQKFFNLVPDCFTDIHKQKKFEKLIGSKVEIQEEIDYLKSKLIEVKSPLVFAHNDLLLGNVIYTQDKNSVTFIDFEYSSLNYQAFDIGNHFAEFVGLDGIDYSKYPNKELQLKWLKTYLEELLETENVSDDDIERLYVQVNQFALAAHLFWGIWALIQAEHSSIHFDFVEYASIRIKEYFAKKDTFLTLNVL